MANIVTVDTPEFKSWLAACQTMKNDNLALYAPTLFASDPNYGLLEVQDGRRYIRIVQKGSAWAFIDKTNGDVLKCASWKTPAKIARGNVFDATNGMSLMTAFGPAYLR